MRELERELSAHPGGTVLDVATGDGDFAALLVRSLRSVERLCGVDVDSDSLEEARERMSGLFPRLPTDLRTAPAEALPFSDAVFDTVAISNALHHVDDVGGTLSEMRRVAKRGALVVVNEMVRDGLTRRQRNARDFHHLKARVDSICGVSHRETLTRREVIEAVATLGLRERKILVCAHPDAGKGEEDELRERVDFIMDYVDHASGHPEYALIKRQARRLGYRISAWGFAHPPQLVIMGRVA